MKSLSRWPIRTVVGLVAGAILAYVDNVAFDGEVSPFVVVLLLLMGGISMGIVWKSRALLPVVLMWLWLPATHVAKKLLGLPDTLQPNTDTSILMLSGFSFIVSGIGLLLGVSAGKIMLHNR